MTMVALPSLSEHLLQLAARATERAHASPFGAEITAEPARWHVIVTEPNRETTAAGHLIGRGFGTYLPEYDEMVITRGRKRVLHQKMFPGYLFVFVWAIERQWRRMAACTGVARMLLNGDRPAIVPDTIINEIQVEEFNQLVNNTSLLASEPGKRKRLKRWERDLQKNTSAELAQTGSTFRVSTKSYFAGLGNCDPVTRNSTLRRALGME